MRAHHCEWGRAVLLVAEKTFRELTKGSTSVLGRFGVVARFARNDGLVLPDGTRLVDTVAWHHIAAAAARALVEGAAGVGRVVHVHRVVIEVVAPGGRAVVTAAKAASGPSAVPAVAAPSGIPGIPAAIPQALCRPRQGGERGCIAIYTGCENRKLP